MRSALVPPGFPIAVADLLRGRGVELAVDHEGFDLRRRRKTRRRARRDPPGDRGGPGVARRGGPRPARGAPARRRPGVGGRGPHLRASARAAGELCGRLGATLPADVIVATMGPGDAIGHESGSGPLRPDTPICFDLWPQDDASGCWTDMTRTYVVGEVSDAVGDLHRLVREAHERSLEQLRPGAVAEAPYDAACDVFEAAGHPTQRTAGRARRWRTASSSASGTASASRCTRRRSSAARSRDCELVAGDVLAVEPGLVVPGLGGCGSRTSCSSATTGSRTSPAPRPTTCGPSRARPALLAGDRLRELGLRHPRPAANARALGPLVELLLGVALDVDAAVGLLGWSRACRPSAWIAGPTGPCGP